MTGSDCINARGFARRLTCISWVASAAALVTIAAPASAAFVSPALWSHGDAHTTWQAWNVFTTTAGANAPDAGLSNPNGAPTLTENSGGSFLTGSGNLYSPAAVLDIDVVIPDEAAAGQVTTVILQTRTLGSEIDYSSINIGDIGYVDYAELLREAFPGPGGEAVERWFKFHLPYSASSFTIAFNADGSSMSLDRVTVDTITSTSYVPEPNPVPEPAALVLALAAAAVVVRRRPCGEAR